MGRDKCLIEIDGTPLWKRQLELLHAVAAEVLVVAPARPGWCPSDARWIADAVPGCGPLGGLAGALSEAGHTRVLVLAVDLPQMSVAYLRRLLALSRDTCGVVPCLDRFQPLSAVYSRSAAGFVEEHLRNEPDKSLQRLIRNLIVRHVMRSVPVDECDQPNFRNLNAPGD